MKTFLMVAFAMLFASGTPRLAYGDGNDSKTVGDQQGKVKIRYRTPVIPYPYEARRNHIQGSGVVQVSFDAQGKVIKAIMIKSTDSNVLDEATTSYAKAYWQSLIGKPSTIEIPVAFSL